MSNDGDALGMLRSRYIQLRQQQAERLGLYLPARDILADLYDVPEEGLRIAVAELEADTGE